MVTWFPWNSYSSLLVAPLPYRLWAPLWWIFNKGLFPSPSEELIKAIEARSDEPHHPDLEAQLSPPPHNYTCIIRTHIHTWTLALTCEGTYSIPIIKRTCATPDQSSSHIPTSLRASESLWSSNTFSTHTHKETLSQGGGGSIVLEHLFYPAL